MKSVRLRLLVLALAPFVVLMPLLLLLGMNRWTADYDKVLIANVESDLRIAEQYLARIMADTGDDLTAIAQSGAFASAAASGTLSAEMARAKDGANLDFLYYLTAEQATAPAETWPVIASALQGQSRSAIDVMSAQDLTRINPGLAKIARIDLIETEAAVPTTRTVEDRGMVVHAAAPVSAPGHRGVLVGGILLNRNLDFIDTINALVYLNADTGGERQGTATLFLEDVRVSTNVRLFEDVRALGTRVSAVVRAQVLDQGATWLNRAFVVNDWYISGYLPLIDSRNQRVGMLYVGFLEAPFTAAKREAFLWMMAAFLGVLAISAPMFLGLAKGIFAPLERMTQTIQQVRAGNLSARIGNVGKNDEIASVAAHLDSLLNQVQDRDRRLRAYADDLNQRVEDRTIELRAANSKLEETFKQLVMKEKLASIGEITAGVAHEINNPVAVIQGNVDVMREALPPEAANSVTTELDLIDRQVTRINAMVGKLLQFARPSEYAEDAPGADVQSVVMDCLVLVEHLLAKGDVTVETSFHPAPEIAMHVGELQQVIINLIVNAIQAMENDGTLTLTCDTQNRDGASGTLLTVQDSGPGIADKDLSAVFDPFFTTKQAEGTGLGLSISQTLVQRAGGLITVENAQPQGAVFQIWLPASDVAHQTAAE